MMYSIPTTLEGLLTWLLVAIVGLLVLYLVWCLFKASIRVLIYLTCIVLLLVLLKKNGLLPPEIEKWLEPKYISERLYEATRGLDSVKTPVEVPSGGQRDKEHSPSESNGESL